MSEQQSWLATVQQMMALAQSGLHYSRDIYDQERYQQLLGLVERLLQLQNIDTQHFQADVLKDVGYATPKIDVRAVIFKQDKILLVKESSDGCWSLPGGWADPGYSASENVQKEVLEETGLEVRVTQLLQLSDMRKHGHKPTFLHVYKAFFRCEVLSGVLTTSYETPELGFFSRSELPKISTARVTEQQIQHFFDRLQQPDSSTQFD
ncbi:NUDIX hydrolase [Acinetobacter larvae]|uniref:ADP-ribose pyrophosphatase n=1 Tax=Acinetobacter larvae TaxID=1789224 RepID=A0A1B2M296_9GAMM|nr:NUDIX hydrolase N-terminal domain-containing protein [Acinetobacter larvae]AOA59326.1 ADP-ribose pyrophosphatase [Acinetobacter larvae]